MWEKKSKNSCSRKIEGKGFIVNEHKKTLGDNVLRLLGVCISQEHVFVKIHLMVCLRFEYFNLCDFYLKRKKRLKYKY